MTDIIRTSDRVDVTRCRDCIYLIGTPDGRDFCLWTKFYREPDEYCSDGERRDNDGADA